MKICFKLFIIDLNDSVEEPILVNYDNMDQSKMRRTFDFNLAQLMPMITNGNLSLNCEMDNFNKIIAKCSTTAVPSYVAYPQTGFDECFRLDIDQNDVQMKVIKKLKFYTHETKNYCF